MSESSFTAALIQQSCGNDVKNNLQQTIAAIREASAAGAKLIVLQELFHLRYFPQTEENHYFDLAETIPGPTTEQLAILTQETNLIIVASLFEQRAKGLY